MQWSVRWTLQEGNEMPFKKPLNLKLTKHIFLKQLAYLYRKWLGGGAWDSFCFLWMARRTTAGKKVGEVGWWYCHIYNLYTHSPVKRRFHKREKFRLGLLRYHPCKHLLIACYISGTEHFVEATKMNKKKFHTWRYLPISREAIWKQVIFKIVIEEHAIPRELQGIYCLYLVFTGF